MLRTEADPGGGSWKSGVGRGSSGQTWSLCKWLQPPPLATPSHLSTLSRVSTAPGGTEAGLLASPPGQVGPSGPDCSPDCGPDYGLGRDAPALARPRQKRGKRDVPRAGGRCGFMPGLRLKQGVLRAQEERKDRRVSEHHPIPREGSADLVLRVPPECPEGFEGGEGGGGLYTRPTMGSLRPGLSSFSPDRLRGSALFWSREGFVTRIFSFDLWGFFPLLLVTKP